MNPNQSIHEYQTEHARKERRKAILIVIGAVCALVLIVCAGLILLSLAGR